MEDKGTKGNRARYVPLIEEVRQLVTRRIAIVGTDNPDARLFRGPRGGRIATGVLRDATHWDEVVTKLGYEHLRRHDLRHTGLTWMADAGVSLHVLQKIAGHADSRTTERYIHPDRREITGAGDKLSKHLRSVLVPLFGWSANEESPPTLVRGAFSSVGLTGFEPATT